MWAATSATRGPGTTSSRDRRGIDKGFLKKVSPKFVMEAAAQLGISHATPARTPGIKVTPKDSDDTEATIEDAKLYRSVVGKLLHVQEDYVDCTYVIKELSRHMAKPRVIDIQALRHLVRYMLGITEDFQEMVPDHDQDCIVIYADSDWAGCKTTARSTDCVVALIYGAMVGFSSRTQTTIAQSSAEAELGAIHRGALAGVYIQNLWHEITGELLKIRVFSGSAAGRAISQRLGVGRVRHLQVRQLYVQSLVAAGRVTIEKVATEENVADLGTKILTRDVIDKHLVKLGITRATTTSKTKKKGND